jgi:hypothetical protein
MGAIVENEKKQILLGATILTMMIFAYACAYSYTIYKIHNLVTYDNISDF